MTARDDWKNIKAVVFDAFGTLVRIGRKRYPYRQLMEKLRMTGREPQKDDASRIMSSKVGLTGVPGLFGVDLPVREIAEIEVELYAELSSVALYQDAIPTIQALRGAGFELAICSNLAAPYAVPVRLLLPALDAYVWSFEAGSVKPEPTIYKVLCGHLGCAPHEVMMIGDTLECDHTAPRRVGIHGIHLVREGKSPVTESVETLLGVLDLLGCASFRPNTDTCHTIV